MAHLWLERLFGERASHNAVGPFSWLDLAIVLGVVLLALMLNALAAWYMRRRAREAAPANVAKPLRQLMLAALGKPLYALIWTGGIYVATISLLTRLPPGDILQTAQEVVDTSFGLGVFAILFWCAYRLPPCWMCCLRSGRARPPAWLTI